MSVIAGGVCCSGSPEHKRRHWIVDQERLLALRDPMGSGLLTPELGDALKRPIPGAANVLTVDPFRLLAVLSSGAVWRLDPNQPSQWRTMNREADMPETGEVKFIAAGTGCGHIWVATADRRLFLWGPGGQSAIGAGPVPGTDHILAVDVSHQTVIVATGERLTFAGGSWGRLPGFSNSKAGFVTVRVLDGICLTIGDRYPGDVVEVPEGEARPLIARRILEVVAIGEAS